MSITRRALRTKVATRLGDITQLEATADGTTTSFIDTIRLSGQIEGPGNRDIIFTTAPNVGVSRRITSYNLSSGTLNFAAITGPPIAESTAEIYNFRGRGWRLEEYNNAIMQAQQGAFPLFKLKVWTTMADTFDAMSGTIDFSGELPPFGVFNYISGVLWVDQAGIWQPIPNAMTSRGQGWSYDGSTGLIDIRGGTVPNGSTMQIVGYGQEYPLDGDSVETAINEEWIINRTCQILCMGATDRDAANYNLGMVYGQNADRLKASIRTRLPSGTVSTGGVLA